jgi:hypothetical protein
MPVENQLIDKWKEEESSGLKGWLEENISKKGMKRSYEKAAAYQKKGMSKEVVPGVTQGDLYSGLTAGVTGAKKIPAIGKGIRNILFKNKYLYEGTVKGATGKRQMINRKFADIMGSSEFSPVGQVKTPTGKMTDVFISDKSMQYAGREMRTAAYKGNKSTLLQPFYKSAGVGTPELKTKGEWIPFEGVLTRSAKIKSWEKGGSGIVSRSKRTGGLKEVPFQNEPGWVIKGHRRPGVSKIMGEAGKRGLTMHQQTNKMLQSYFNK